MSERPDNPRPEPAPLPRGPLLAAARDARPPSSAARPGAGRGALVAMCVFAVILSVGIVFKDALPARLNSLRASVQKVFYGLSLPRSPAGVAEQLQRSPVETDAAMPADGRPSPMPFYDGQSPSESLVPYTEARQAQDPRSWPRLRQIPFLSNFASNKGMTGGGLHISGIENPKFINVCGARRGAAPDQGPMAQVPMVQVPMAQVPGSDKAGLPCPACSQRGIDNIIIGQNRAQK